jgi:hypothetical protein
VGGVTEFFHNTVLCIPVIPRNDYTVDNHGQCNCAAYPQQNEIRCCKFDTENNHFCILLIRTYLKKRILVQNQGGREYPTGSASEANARRGKYIRYFEDWI